MLISVMKFNGRDVWSNIGQLINLCFYHFIWTLENWSRLSGYCRNNVDGQLANDLLTSLFKFHISDIRPLPSPHSPSHPLLKTPAKLPTVASTIWFQLPPLSPPHYPGPEGSNPINSKQRLSLRWLTTLLAREKLVAIVDPTQCNLLSRLLTWPCPIDSGSLTEDASQDFSREEWIRCMGIFI